jgi:hypothetical protein
MEPVQIVMDTPASQGAKINPKTEWWLKNKDDPRIVECMREARRKYYYKNQEKEKQRGREYYHKKKALAQEQVRQEEQEKED